MTQASPSRSYALLATLLDSGRLEWEQPVEGRLVEARTFSLEPGESRQSLLQLRNNDISFLQADIGARSLSPLILLNLSHCRIPAAISRRKVPSNHC